MDFFTKNQLDCRRYFFGEPEAQCCSNGVATHFAFFPSVHHRVVVESKRRLKPSPTSLSLLSHFSFFFFPTSSLPFNPLPSHTPLSPSLFALLLSTLSLCLFPSSFSPSLWASATFPALGQVCSPRSSRAWISGATFLTRLPHRRTYFTRHGFAKFHSRGCSRKHRRRGT